MCCVNELYKPVEEWACSGVPLTAFFNVERRHGKDKPVIKKALVELDSLPYKTFAAHRGVWGLKDAVSDFRALNCVICVIFLLCARV